MNTSIYLVTLEDGTTGEVRSYRVASYDDAYESASDVQQMGGAATIVNLATGKTTALPMILIGRN